MHHEDRVMDFGLLFDILETTKDLLAKEMEW